MLTTDAAFDKLGNGDKVTVGGVDYTYNAKSGDFTTTKSTAGTGVDAAAQAADSASKRDALAATLHADVGKSVNGSYTTKMVLFLSKRIQQVISPSVEARHT